jgi:endonuclease/exonuclease/phosphatase family metal-dependent hydrolase
MHYGDPPPYIAQGLLELRKRIDAAEVPASKLDESLNVATWNIREFGRKPRLEASIYYIAEILNQFDLIALTELRDNLGDLERVMKLLGREWDVVFSDYTNDRGGNHERIAYLFDRRMVTLTGLAAEADPPRKKIGGEYLPEFSWWRSPYMASFRAGNFGFVVLTAHIRWGNSIADRVAALAEFRRWVSKRRKQKFAVDRDIVVMGDFNVPSRDHAAYKALTGNGRTLKLPDGLLEVEGTNLSRRNTYDQILHSPTSVSRFSGRGGVIDFYDGGNWKPLYPSAQHRPTAKRISYELSDHLPLWVQVETDIMDERLKLMTADP